MPATMRAVLLTGHGGLDRLHVALHHPCPSPAAGEVLVRVGACAINATDVNTRVGWYARGDDNGAWDEPVRFPRVQGADVCGEVVEMGQALPGVTVSSALTVGARVMVDPWLRDRQHPHRLDGCGYVGSEIDGGYAEYLVVPVENAHPVNSPLSDAELASFATSWGTALNMLERVGLRAGDTVLVTGASGGVGTALVHIARLFGATVLAVTTAHKAERVLAEGAHVVLDRAQPLAPQLDAACGVRTVDVVADVVGGPQWGEVFALLRRGGRYVVSGALGGAEVPLDLRMLYLADLTMFGATVMPPGLFGRLVGMVERGELVPVVAATYPFPMVREAQSVFERKVHVGKIVLEGWE